MVVRGTLAARQRAKAIGSSTRTRVGESEDSGSVIFRPKNGARLRYFRMDFPLESMESTESLAVLSVPSTN